MERFKNLIDRLRELQGGAVELPDGDFRALPPDTLRDLDDFFREQILQTDELTEGERSLVVEHYLLTAC